MSHVQSQIHHAQMREAGASHVASGASPEDVRDCSRARPARAGLSRRNVIRAGLAVASGAAMSWAAPSVRAGASTSGYDPQQRFLQLAGGGNGQVFAVQADGSLLWYRNAAWTSATASWVSGSGRRIGSEWHQFQVVMGSLDGSLYALRGDGTLYYYRYALTNATTGAGSWVASKRIGSGFDTYARVFGFNGDIYGVTAAGDLVWYHYSPSTGSWDNSSGLRLSGSFKNSVLYADASGVLYAYRFGNLYWHRHLSDGTWVGGSGCQIGSGFSELAIHGLQFMGQGLVYAVRPTPPTLAATGLLFAYRLTNYTTAGAGASWANGGSGMQVGIGWTMERQAALQGYAITPSVTQGETLSVAVSSTFASYSWSVVRVGAGADLVPVTGPVSQGGGVQQLPVGFFITGCAWGPSVNLPIPQDWAPGLYAVLLQGPYGLRRSVPFVVKPATVTNHIAVVLPTNTYTAYNTWGGHSQYCADLTGVRYVTTQRPSTEHAIEATGLVEHTLWSDVMLLQWLSGQALAADCYTDEDLHNGAQWVSQYKVLVLGSHPEYWSDEMRQNVLNFLQGGGRLIYAGGNGIYERVTYDATMHTVISRRADGSRELFSELGLPASQVLGVNYRSATWFTFAPYTVTTQPEILTGTGLVVGDTFGDSGYNGPASGWEMDGFLGWDGEATPDQVIAQGDNAGCGGVMVLRDTPTGGFVFSASSISFSGALASSTAMSRLFRNVFDKALAAPLPQPNVTATPNTVAPKPAQSEAPPVK